MSWNTNLTGEHLNIAASTAPRIRVMAGPGTGKSFAMKRRIARLIEVDGVAPERILAVTFTRTAARDLERELQNMGVPGCEDISAGTVHAFCFRLLMSHEVFGFLGRVPRGLITFNNKGVSGFEVEPLLADLQPRGAFGAKRAMTGRIRAFEAAWARLQHERPGWAIDPLDQQFHALLAAWLRFHRGMLIGELVPEALRYLRNNPASPALQQFDHIVVDEYQDLNRAEHIDPALKAAGWGVVEGSRILREYYITPGRIEGLGRRSKPLKADYILVYRNTKLAVIEAKAWDEELTEGVGQAKDYSGKLAVRFAYSTNGRGIYAIDMETGKEGEIAGYPSPEELWQMTFARQNEWRDRFSEVAFEDKGGSHPSRYYQDTAIENVLEAMAAGKNRILLTLATGTGKTFIAFQIAWKLFHSRWNLSGEPTRRPRILFLADRNILANQAYNAFSAFPEDALVRIDPESIRKKGRVPTNGSLFFTIFQTFMSGQDEGGQPSPYFGDYPPDFFDFIVIDECHRGGANDESNWRDIMEYFSPAVQLGLTATPKRDENVDTYRYFGEPVYIYSLKDGINDGYLTPFKVKQIQTTLDEYVYTPDDRLIEGEIESGKLYTETDFNRIIEIKEREKKRVQIFMEQINQNEKTIVFCATQDHALAVRDLINQMKTSKDPGYCQRVTANDGALGEQHLRDFQDNEKTIPTILTTSQKLSTGVDARNIRNIVLMRSINQIIEFKQIIGRGTRLYDGKDYFTIYDFVQAHHHFSDPEWDGEPLEPEEPAPKPEQPPRPPMKTGEEREKYPKKQKIKVKLADGKARNIQHMMVTSFWHPDGTPMSAQQFMELLFGKLPEFFKNEDELRRIWSAPDTRKKLLQGLSEKGFGTEQLTEMQKIIDAEKSDIFDVLAYVAYAMPTVRRDERAANARVKIHQTFDAKQQAFLEFVLQHYVSVGVEELDLEKLTPLLRLKYNDSIADAIADLGRPEAINAMFAGFQQYLYLERPVA